MALKRLVTACLAFISVICIAGCSFFDDVVHLKNDNEAILASDQNRMLLQALALQKKTPEKARSSLIFICWNSASW